MKTIAFALALAALPLIGGTAANAAPERATTLKPASEAAQPADTSARRKGRHHRHVYRSYRSTYGYDRPYGYGYYRGIRPGWGYGPDPGDYAWPPFHFKPYW
jgi:hypothetical protein